jgi:hypothetical protein
MSEGESEPIMDANAASAEAALTLLLEKQHKIVQHHLDDPLIRAQAPGRVSDVGKFAELEQQQAKLAKRRRKARVVVDPTVGF